MKYVVLALGLEFPALVALTDAFTRHPAAFEGGAEDRTAWIRWLLISLALCPVLIGYGIVLGYYSNVVKRTGAIVPKGGARGD